MLVSVLETCAYAGECVLMVSVCGLEQLSHKGC